MKVLLGLTLTLVAFAARAEDHEKHPQCAADVEAFCKDVAPGEGRIAMCLKAHEDKISAECKTSIENIKAAVKEAKDACEEDIKKFCPNEKPGGGRVMKCLRGHKKELSAECQASWNKAKEVKKAK